MQGLVWILMTMCHFHQWRSTVGHNSTAAQKKQFHSLMVWYCQTSITEMNYIIRRINWWKNSSLENTVVSYNMYFFTGLKISTTLTVCLLTHQAQTGYSSGASSIGWIWSWESGLYLWSLRSSNGQAGALLLMCNSGTGFKMKSELLTRIQSREQINYSDGKNPWFILTFFHGGRTKAFPQWSEKSQ